MWRKHIYVIILAVASLTLSACMAPQTSRLVGSPGTLPVRAAVQDVPFFPQEENFCGPAALATVLVWSGVAADPSQIGERVYTPGRNGTLQSDILSATRREGRLGVPVHSLRDIIAEISAGHPVLVLQNLSFNWYPQWHYAVAVAYDLEGRTVTLRSGRDPERTMSMSTFERTWQRGDHWALVILKPDDLPASADMIDLERAATALEGAGRTGEAATAYSAILSKWPNSYAALMGLGNVSYADGDFAAAEMAFRKATAIRPERAEAWNNLAYVLAAQGQQSEAIVAANKAFDLATGDRQPYLETLQDVSEI